MFTLNVGLFFLSIPIPGFVPSDRFAWNGPLRLSFTDRRNSSLRSSDTTGRAFGNPNRTLVPAPMVFRHKTLHLPSARQGKEGKFCKMKYRITSIVIWIAELLYRSVFSTFDFNSISGIRNGKPLFRCDFYFSDPDSFSMK